MFYLMTKCTHAYQNVGAKAVFSKRYMVLNACVRKEQEMKIKIENWMNSKQNKK